MNRLIFTALLLCPAALFARGNQRLRTEDIYPRPKALSIPKKISEADNAIFYYLFTYGTCAEGNCSKGPGVYFYFSGANAVDGLFTVSLLMWKGTFSNNGADFEGSKYLIPLHYCWAEGKVGEELRPLDRYDFSDDKQIKHYLVASGRFARGASHYEENYDGHGLRLAYDTIYNPVMVSEDLAAYRALPRATDLQVWYAGGKPRKAATQYDATSPLKHFAGFCHPDYSPALGTAEYANGDRYTGFLLRDKPFGAGILIDKNASVQRGYFYDGRLVQTADITLPEFVGKPAMPVSGGRAAQIQMGGAVSGTMWGDGGGGLFISNSGDLFYTGRPGAGNVIEGWATTMQWEDVKVAYGVMPQLRSSQYSGVFKSGLIAEGAAAAINFSKPLPPADYKLDTGWYSSTLIAIRRGSYAGGKLAGCGLVSYLYAKGTGSFEMEANFKDDFAEPGSWVKINATDRAPLSSGLQLLDNRDYYCDALHNDTLSIGRYNAAKALPMSCSLGTESEKSAYLAKMLRNITEADARKARLAQRAADEAKRSADARYMTLSKVYYNKSHPEKCCVVGTTGRNDPGQAGANAQVTLKPKMMRAWDAQVGDAVFYEGQLYTVGDKIDGFLGMAGSGGKKLNAGYDSIAVFENCTFVYDNTDWVCPVCHGERGTFGGKGYVYAITSYKESRSYAGPGLVQVNYAPQYTPVAEGKAQFYPCESCHGVGSRSTHNTITVME